MNDALLFRDKPVFGLDVGFNTIKVMELTAHGKKYSITGYGMADFDPKVIKDGVIIDPEALAKTTLDLFKNKIIGDITTRRVTLSVPAVRTFSRTVQLPKLEAKELDEAVRLEAQQYIPVPTDNLYIDYEVISTTPEQVELLVSAVPKEIIDSYMRFASIVGLEVLAIETTISACSRLFRQTSESDIPTILIDFGSMSSDITIYDRTLVVTGTSPSGGDNFTSKIASTLKVSQKEAQVIKAKYGLSVSKKQKEIIESVSPILESLTKEIRRMIRYYEERAATDRTISQIVTMGGGANMPGLAEFMTDRLRLPVRTFHPWQEFEFSRLQPPSELEKSLYVTVAGLALVDPKEVFA